MSLRAPTSRYEAAWQQWNYGGGGMRGEPPPRPEDYPDDSGDGSYGSQSAPWVTEATDYKPSGDPSNAPPMSIPSPYPGAGEKYPGGIGMYDDRMNEDRRRNTGTIYHPPGASIQEWQPERGIGSPYLPAPAAPEDAYGADARPSAPFGMGANVLGGMASQAMRSPAGRGMMGGMASQAMRSPAGRGGLGGLIGTGIGRLFRRPARRGQSLAAMSRGESA